MRKPLLASTGLALALSVAIAQNQPAPVAIGDVVAPDALVSGSVVLISHGGTRVMSGSSVLAGNSAASLRLLRGGEVLVCPHARLSLTNSQGGRDLVLGMGTGVIETHYHLGANADTILTPDFRILLAGPGNFHIAIGTDPRGNTCVRSLPNNGAAVIVTEQMGDGVYQVLPGEQAYFRAGTISGAQNVAPPDCGCPLPAPTVQANNAPPPTPAPPPVAPAAAPAISSNDNAPSASPAPAATDTAKQPPENTVTVPANAPEAVIASQGTPVPAPLNAAPKPNDSPPPAPSQQELHVQVDAPFVYRGEDPGAPPPPMLARLRMTPMPRALSQDVPVLPPPANAQTQAAGDKSAAAAKPRKGFFGHIKSFFAGMFK